MVAASESDEGLVSLIFLLVWLKQAHMPNFNFLCGVEEGSVKIDRAHETEWVVGWGVVGVILIIRLPPRSTQLLSSSASDVYLSEGNFTRTHFYIT